MSTNNPTSNESLLTAIQSLQADIANINSAISGSGPVDVLNTTLVANTEFQLPAKGFYRVISVNGVRSVDLFVTSDSILSVKSVGILSFVDGSYSRRIRVVDSLRVKFDYNVSAIFKM